jgi:hypothetical protein
MITAATPMRMPDIVSAERSLFDTTPRVANRTLSCTLTGPPRAGPPGRRVGSRRDPPVGHDAPVPHPHHPLGVVRHLLLVGDHDDRPAVRVQVGEQREDVVGAAAVERARRLVGEQEHRVRRDRAGDRHPLLLAARQLRRQVVHPVAQPDLLQRADRPLPGAPRRAPA